MWIKPAGGGSGSTHVSARKPHDSEGQDGDTWFVLPFNPAIIVPGADGWANGSLSGSTGEPIPNPRIRTINFIPAPGGRKVSFSWTNDPELRFSIFEYEADGTFISNGLGWRTESPHTWTLNENTALLKIICSYPSGQDASGPPLSVITDVAPRIDYSED